MIISNGLTPHQLVVDDVAATVASYTAAFNAVERYREYLLDGQILYAEIVVGRYVLGISPRWRGAPDGVEPAEAEDRDE